MKVSVIVPLYNNRAYVGATIDSILGQTLPPDELIVVDDGSTDGGADIVAGYGGAVRLLRQENRGPATAINRALRLATGDFVAFLDADDLWTSGKLALQGPLLAEDTSLDGVFGGVEQFLSEELSPARARYLVPETPMVGIHRSTLLIRRAAFDRFGTFDESFTSSDFVNWWARVSVLGFRYRVLEEVVARRRIHANNMGIVRRHEQQQDSLAGLRDALTLRRAMTPPPR